MAAKKTKRKTTRKRTRKPPEPKTESPRTQTSQATAVQEAPDFSPELAELPLNVQSVDEAEPPPMSIDPDAGRTDRELLEGKKADRYEQNQKMALCELPEIMASPRVGRKVLAEYLQTHDVTHQHLLGIEITPRERVLHKLYRPLPESTGLVDIMYFAAALRLWKKGMPLDPKKNLDLNAIKVEV
jgi:hypothetical protein